MVHMMVQNFSQGIFVTVWTAHIATEPKTESKNQKLTIDESNTCSHKTFYIYIYIIWGSAVSHTICNTLCYVMSSCVFARMRLVC